MFFSGIQFFYHPSNYIKQFNFSFGMAYFVWIIKDCQKKIYLCVNDRCDSKKVKKPTISVTVVTITPPPIAGSNFNFLNKEV